MDRPVSLSPKQVQQLLTALSQQLNCDPNQLRQMLQSGNFASALKGNDAQQLQSLLRNPKQLKQLMNSPDMQELLRRLQGK